MSLAHRKQQFVEIALGDSYIRAMLKGYFPLGSGVVGARAPRKSHSH